MFIQYLEFVRRSLILFSSPVGERSTSVMVKFGGMLMSARENSHSSTVAPTGLRSSDPSNELIRADMNEGLVFCRRNRRSDRGDPSVREYEVVEEIREDIGASISSSLNVSSTMFSNDTPLDGRKLLFILENSILSREPASTNFETKHYRNYLS
jgi:hypothetical protein